MCVPLGHRNGSRRSSGRKAITKSQVEKIIISGDYICEYRRLNESEFSPYEGCKENLIMILREESTTVKVADMRFNVYKEGVMTIIIDAPCMSAIILIRR